MLVDYFENDNKMFLPFFVCKKSLTPQIVKKWRELTSHPVYLKRASIPGLSFSIFLYYLYLKINMKL